MTRSIFVQEKEYYYGNRTNKKSQNQYSLIRVSITLGNYGSSPFKKLNKCYNSLLKYHPVS